MRVFVTGGAGYIGSHLADALIKRGDEVLVIDNLSTGRFENIRHLQGHPAFRFINDTILNESLLERMIPSRDLIFHLAAAVGVRQRAQGSAGRHQHQRAGNRGGPGSRLSVLEAHCDRLDLGDLRQSLPRSLSGGRRPRARVHGGDALVLLHVQGH